MKASIIIPTYNKLQYLKATFSSLESLDASRESFEVIVVDDGSDDGTAEFLSGKKFDFRLRVLSHSNNRGRSTARNTGIRQANGRVVIFLDDDMQVAPNFLRAHLERQRGNHRLVVLGNVSSAPQVRRTALVRYLDSRGVHKLKRTQIAPFRYFATGNVSVERALLLEAGLFDERFREFGGEDLELGYRLNKTSAEFVYEPEARSYRMDYGDVTRLCSLMMTYGRCSMPILIQAHPELKELLRADLLDPVAFGFEPFSRSIIKALFRFALWRPWVSASLLVARSFNCLYVPAPLFDYLIVSHSLRGLRSLQQGQGMGGGEFIDEDAEAVRSGDVHS